MKGQKFVDNEDVIQVAGYNIKTNNSSIMEYELWKNAAGPSAFVFYIEKRQNITCIFCAKL